MSIIVGLISLAGVLGAALQPRLLPSVCSRGDRAMALQEIELLIKLDPSAAKQLSEIIGRRIEGWHAKMFPRARRDHISEALAETFKPYDGPVPRSVRVVQVAIVVVCGSLFVFTIWAGITHPSGGKEMHSCGLLLSGC